MPSKSGVLPLSNLCHHMGPPEEAEPYQVLLLKKDGSTAIYASYP